MRILTIPLASCSHHWLLSMCGIHFSIEEPRLFVVVQSLSYVWLFVTPWTAGCQASLSFTISQSLLKLMSIESVMPSSHVIRLSTFFSCHQYFPASESFLTSWLFTSGGQSIETSASASVLLVNIQDFPFELTGLISLQSKRLSRVCSNTTVQKHLFFGFSLLYGPTLTSIHDYWKNYNFDYMDLCWQSDVFSL